LAKSEIQLVSKLHFEDFTPGRVFEHGPRRVPRDEMIAFAAEFDRCISTRRRQNRP
jgi:hypothetical protein